MTKKPRFEINEFPERERLELEPPPTKPERRKYDVKINNPFANALKGVKVKRENEPQT